ncbi:MAG: YjgB family protein [Thermincola sp.]|jgi:bla regulator protein BlaR1|nr:YjgB family protein [Thermincola sp.]MDT3702836.1 YjgB family protein [Thermincola sp.]
MIRTYKKTSIKWAVAALTTTLIVGCAGPDRTIQSTNSDTPTIISQNQEAVAATGQQKDPATNSAESMAFKNTQFQATQPTKTTDPNTVLLLNMKQLARQGKVINSAFPILNVVKCGVPVEMNIEAVENSWGKADKTNYVASAKGLYATYASHDIIFGVNEEKKIFEIQSFDGQLKGISLAKAKEVFGAPAYDIKSNDHEIIGYTTGSEFKIEMVFPKSTSANPNPFMEHYNVLYPKGTANSKANDPGRQW